jgi:hypothetical protein
MQAIVFFSTCSASAAELEDHIPIGITLSQLGHFDSETERFDFSNIRFAANIDFSKITIKEAISFLLSKCSKVGHKHHFEINGRRFSTQDANAIYREAEKNVWRLNASMIPDNRTLSVSYIRLRP